jgi:hypothetical protein
LEGHDQGQVNILDCALTPAVREMGEEWRGNLLGGAVILQAPGVVEDRSSWEGLLYRSLPVAGAASGQAVDLVAIPYYAWANRGPSPMRVWIPAETPWSSPPD